LFVDYLPRGRHHIIKREHEILGLKKMAPLTGEGEEAENPANGGVRTVTVGEDALTGSETLQGAQPIAFKDAKDTQ
jgi:hypothetical protein